MKFILFVLLAIYTQISFAEESLKFSAYESSLRVHEIDRASHSVTFAGEIEISGTLVFRLDMISETEFGEPLSINFIPNNDQLTLLPQVTDGFYAKELDAMSLLDANKLYNQLYGEDFLAKEDELRNVGTLKVKSYGTSVECDSRYYFASAISFEPSELTQSKNLASINEC